MVGYFDTPRYLQRSSICCEVLFRPESYPLEIGAWYSGIHQWYLRFWHYIPARDHSSRYSLEVFANADYASKATDRRSVSGGAIMCGGACVCWFSRTQKCVTLSTSETEFVALGDAVKELLLLRQVWRFMIPGKGMPCFPVFEVTKVLYNSRRTRCRTQIRNISMFVIISRESLSARGTSS